MDYFAGMSYINSGSDARIYGNENLVVKKILRHHNENCNEAKIALWLQSQNLDMIPKIYWAGEVNDNSVIVRENVSDWLTNEETNDELIAEDERLYGIDSAIAGIWFACRQYFEEGEDDSEDIINGAMGMSRLYGVTDIIDEKFVRKCVNIYHTLYDNGVYIRDMSLSNMGLTDNGDIVFRDMGRFYITPNSKINDIEISKIGSRDFEELLSRIEEEQHYVASSTLGM